MVTNLGRLALRAGHLGLEAALVVGGHPRGLLLAVLEMLDDFANLVGRDIVTGEFFRHLVDSLAPAPGPFLFWLGRELAWWAVVSLLGGLLACFALESETVRGLAAALAPRRLAAREERPDAGSSCPGPAFRRRDLGVYGDR